MGIGARGEIGDVNPVYAVETALRRENIDLPAGYSIRWSGRYEYMERAKEHLAIVIPFTIITIMLLLFLNSSNPATRPARPLFDDAELGRRAQEQGLRICQ